MWCLGFMLGWGGRGYVGVCDMVNFLVLWCGGWGVCGMGVVVV